MLLDIVLPGIDGVEVLRQIQASQFRSDRGDDECISFGGPRRRGDEAWRI